MSASWRFSQKPPLQLPCNHLRIPDKLSPLIDYKGFSYIMLWGLSTLLLSGNSLNQVRLQGREGRAFVRRPLAPSQRLDGCNVTSCTFSVVSTNISLTEAGWPSAWGWGFFHFDSAGPLKGLQLVRRSLPRGSQHTFGAMMMTIENVALHVDHDLVFKIPSVCTCCHMLYTVRAGLFLLYPCGCPLPRTGLALKALGVTSHCPAWQHGSDAVKCHFAIAHRGSEVLRGPYPWWWETNGTQLKVTRPGSWIMPRTAGFFLGGEMEIICIFYVMSQSSLNNSVGVKMIFWMAASIKKICQLHHVQHNIRHRLPLQEQPLIIYPTVKDESASTEMTYTAATALHWTVRWTRRITAG